MRMILPVSFIRHGRFTRRHALVIRLPWPTWLCVVVSTRFQADGLETAPHISTRLLIYLSIYPSVCPHILHIRRKDLIPIHLSIYYFLLSFIFGKWGQGYVRLWQSSLIQRGMAAFLCLLHWRDGLLIPTRRFLLFLYIWGEKLASTPRTQSTMFPHSH